MGKYIWLSYPIGLQDATPPAIPAPELTDLYTVDKDGARVQVLRIANHTGTHVDTPMHVVQDGFGLDRYGPEDLIFVRPVVVDLPLQDAEILQPDHLEPFADRLQTADLALFRFGYGEVRGTDPGRYSERCPGFGIESAQWLRRTCPDLRAMGMDVPSVAVIAFLDQTMRAHNVLLEGDGRRFLIIEEMKLDQNLDGLREVRVSPWRVTGMDSGPCSIVGVIEDA